MNSPVLVGLSGGVDSAVAASLLKRDGHSVQGAFMKNWDEDPETGFCSAFEDYEDANRIADQLGIELKTVSFVSEYWERVFADFLTGCEAGITPNPDVLCNREIKFRLFVDYASELGIQRIATGHYARVEPCTDGVGLFRPTDHSKDQTYFLNAVPRDRLSRCLFPLSTMTKSEVRDLARNLGLHVHQKPDSTGICFIGERRFSKFIGKYIAGEPGEIQSASGTLLGKHAGLALYTIGQRKGLAIGGRRDSDQSPWYVLEKVPERNLLVVTQDEADLASDGLAASHLNMLVDSTDWFEDCLAMVRYRQGPQPCNVEFTESGIEVRFDRPQRAITPGQYVVFYREDRCLGGARIDRAR